MAQGGGTDASVGLSGASTATSGQQLDFRGFFGENASGGAGSSAKWFPLAGIAGVVVIAVIWLVTRAGRIGERSG